MFVGIHGKTGQTSFYENGQLRYCELSEKITIGGQSFKKKDAVIFNPDGRVAEIYAEIARKAAGKLAAQSKDYSAKFPKIVIDNN